MSSPAKILITEDEMLVALDLERRLRRLGYVCQIAASGEEAIAAAATLQPALVLMDICLQGGMDGVQAAEQIRTCHDIPIIYLTANADEHTLQRAKLTRPTSYLLKPFKERELQICIEMALVNHALQRELRAARTLLEQRVVERTAELQRANEALQEEIRVRHESEAHVREQAALLDKAQDAILVRNVGGKILYWNQSAERLYGVAKPEALGQTAADVLAEDAEPVAKALSATLARGEWMGELIHHNRAGAELTVESRWTLVRDGTAILVVNTDITERKKIEAQFLRAQRLESVGALASGIAHDLNNVFTPLLMTAQMLGDDTTDPKINQLADIILSSARRGSEMVKQILLFVRGTEGERQPFRIEHLVKEVVNLLRDTFPRSIRLRSTFTPNLWSVVGDATRLHQVLMNLCVNARDAMPEGGELTITLTNHPIDEAFARLHGSARPGDYLRLTVADTGMGMSPEILKNIFDPFFTTKARGQGTGLGLSTVQAIVREHEGFLQVESTPGIGSRFHVFVPADSEFASPETLVAPELPRGNGERIMIADDERMVREIMKTSLEAYNYRVVTADDGAHALSTFALDQNGFDAVIIDLKMPHLNGNACVQALRRIRKDLPILAVSGSPETDVPRAELGSQKVSFLAKPFTKAALLTAVQRLLTRGGDAATLIAFPDSSEL